MARRRRSTAASRLVQAGELPSSSRALALPRVAALSTLYHEDDALRFIRHDDYMASARTLALPRRFSAKPNLPYAKLTARGPYLSKLLMSAPKRVLFCLRRKIRKEVIFATKRNGRNGGRRYRRRQESQYAC